MKKRGYVEGSGNIFADLGVANPEEARAKADLVDRIVDIIQERKLTQVQAAKALGIDQPKVSALMRGRLAGFSIERLLRFLLLLGQDVQIAVTARPRSSRKPPALQVFATAGRSKAAASVGSR
ncbi:MAG: helix-turn-helix transcriptional regulator [Terriglobales bacterium]|jgi:predicted XRE-type DNA-binding protein